MRFLLFVGGWSFGGVETAYLSLMKGLRARGHDATAIVCGWTDGIVPERLQQAGLPYHQVRLGRLYLTNPWFTWHTLWRMPAARRQLRRLFQELRPDWVIYSEPQMVLLTASLLPTRRAMYLQAEPGRLMLHDWSQRALDRRIDRFVAVSDFIARSLPVDPRKRAVAYNGVELREPVARAANPVHIGIVGRLDERKQHLVLLEACVILKGRLPPDAFMLDIVGERPAPTRARSRSGSRSAGWATSCAGPASSPTATRSMAASTFWRRRRSTSRSG